MKVLMITGDKNLLMSGTSAYDRLALQRGVVESLVVLYVGRGSMWPKVPHEHFDVVTSQDPFWRGLIAWRMAYRTKARLNLQIHADLRGQPWWKRMLASFLLRRADSVRVVSRRIQTQVQAMGIRTQVQVLPVYVDVGRFRHLARESHDTKTILWIGRFEEEKDPARALQVLKEVRAEGVDVKLVMLGSGTMEGELRRLAKGLPVEFPGWQDTALYLSKADIVLATSPYESWGASIVEALAAGIPVVAPDIGVAREAGAIVVPREKLAGTVIGILKNGAQSELKLKMLTTEEWADAWKKSL